jgi:hypothetical protein
MKYYVIYLPGEGNKPILISGSCADQDFGLERPDGGIWVETSEFINPALYYISESNTLTPYTNDEIVRKNDRPNIPSRWNIETKEWEDLRSIADLKVIKNSIINESRLKANRDKFSFNNKDFACDELSRSDIDGVNGIVTLTGQLPPGWPGGWKAIDNTYVPIPDVATWVAFYAAMVTKGTQNFAHAQALKIMLSNATTKEEIESITWETPTGG